MKTIDICGHPFDIHDGPLGISVSGGADSAAMLYILMTHAPGPIHVYTCGSREKNLASPETSLKLVHSLLNQFKRNDVYYHVFYTDKQTSSNLLYPLWESVEKEKLSMMYLATTAFPPKNEYSKFNNQAVFLDLDHERNPDVIRDCYIWKNKKFYVPWTNKDKKFVAKIYDYFNITETIFPITRSCESFTLRSGHCGKCWWCEERLWAFDRLE